MVRLRRRLCAAVLSACVVGTSPASEAQIPNVGGIFGRVVAAAQSNNGSSSPTRSADANGGSDCNHTGAIIGGVAGIAFGALAGRAIGGKRGGVLPTIIGGGLGGVLGASIGREIDRRNCRLKQIAKIHNLDMPIVEIPPPVDYRPAFGEQPPKFVGLSVSIVDAPQEFASGADYLTPEAQSYFGQIADTYVYQKQNNDLTASATDDDRKAVQSLEGKVILLIGHTDDTGPSALNAALSERRAATVAKVFEQHGIPSTQLYYQGAGETLPLESNDTEEGRSKNRRVEILDFPDTTVLYAYLADRFPNLQNYRAAQTDWRAEPGASSSSEESSSPSRGTTTSGKHKPTAAVARATAGQVPKSAGDVLVGSPSLTTNPTTVASSSPPPAPHKAYSASAGKTSVAARQPAQSNSLDIDFGGHQAGKAESVDIGRLPSRPGLSLVARANAATLDRVGLASCEDDKPRIAYAVKALKTGSPLPFPTSDYMRGLYGTAWSDTVNGQLVGLTGVAVLRDGGTPAAKPDLLVFRNYAAKPDPSRSPELQERPDVNVYRGGKALLYRVFVRNAANIRCLDIVLPPAGGFSAPSSQLYYRLHGELYVADFAPKIARQ